MNGIDARRERLTERRIPADSRFFGLALPAGNPCWCSKLRRPCPYHEGVEAGVDAVLAVLVLVGWLDPDRGHANRFHSPDCRCSQPLQSQVHRPENRIYQEETTDG